MSASRLLTRTIAVFAIAAALSLLPSVPGLDVPVARADTVNPWSLFGTRWENDGYRPRGRARDRNRARAWETQPPIGLPTISRANIAPIKAAIQRYAAIVAKGGWRRIPAVHMQRGNRGEPIRLLRYRLIASGDLVETGRRVSSYDYYVEQAVQRFQIRHGLTPTGIIDRSTLMALNVPAEARLRQLRLNLSRVRALAGKGAKKYVLVNIPAAQIEAVDGDRVVSRHAAVVGKIDRQSPVLRSTVHEINFNPYWHVPQSIVRKDLVPKARQYARRGMDVLSIYRIDAYDGRGRKINPARINWFSNAVYGYAYRQQPWEDNSMGFVKINFHNAHSVYLHDTPSKSLFGRNFRAHSSGCVRVQNVEQLVGWLLHSNGGWDTSRVLQMKHTGERKDVRLKRRVPIYFAYVTAWATRDGNVHFRRDLYRRDGVGPTASAY